MGKKKHMTPEDLRQEIKESFLNPESLLRAFDNPTPEGIAELRREIRDAFLNPDEMFAALDLLVLRNR